MLVKTNFGGLLCNCKNVNPLRDLKTTKLEVVNLTCTDLKNPLVERLVMALRPVPTIRRLILAENWEVDGNQLGNLFRLKKIRANVEEMRIDMNGG